jgi:hypothetical protein
MPEFNYVCQNCGRQVVHVFPTNEVVECTNEECKKLNQPNFKMLMDYAIAPGKEIVFEMLKKIFECRPNTECLKEPEITSVEAFIKRLGAAPPALIFDKPVGNLLIAAHWALPGVDHRPENFWDIPLLRKQKTKTYYSLVKDIADKGDKRVHIDDALVRKEQGISPPPPPGADLVQINVHIRSCALGKAPAFLQKLKKAFGKNVRTVTAPKYIVGTDNETGREWIYMGGCLEHLLYEFSVFIKYETVQTINKSVLVKAFSEKYKKFFNGKPIKNEYWTSWIPKDEDLFKGEVVICAKYCPLGQTIGYKSQFMPAINSLPIAVRYIYDFNTDMTITVPSPYAESPDHLKALENYLKDDPNPEYPLYKRAGYDNLNEFINGFAWFFNEWPVCSGSRHEFRILMPITDPDTGNPDDPKTWHLIFNYYPASKKPEEYVFKMKESDTRLFENV